MLQWAEGGGSNGKWIANATQMAASNSYGLTWCAWGSGWCMKRDSSDVEFGALDLWRRTSIEAGQPDGKTRLKGQGGGYNGVLDANIFQLRYRETPPTTKAGMLEIKPGSTLAIAPGGKVSLIPARVADGYPSFEALNTAPFYVAAGQTLSASPAPPPPYPDSPFVVADFETGDNSARGCDGIATADTLVIPQGVTSIPFGFFSYCTNSISEIVFPDSLTAIANQGMFRGTAFTGVTKIELPSAIESLGGYALSGRNALVSITMRGDGTRSNDFEIWPHYVFLGCKAFKYIQIKGPISRIHSTAFRDTLTSVDDQFGTNIDWEHVGATCADFATKIQGNTNCLEPCSDNNGGMAASNVAVRVNGVICEPGDY